jgi:hypothetical protein
MKEKFPGYYLPSKAEFDELWKSCLFSFDTSFLINLYEKPEHVRNGYLGFLTSFGNRIWLTNHVALEYHTKRPKKTCQQLGRISEIQSHLRKLDLQPLAHHQPYVSPETVAELQGSVDKVLKELDEAKKAHDFVDTESDPILLKLTQLFDGRTGEPYSAERVAEIVKDGGDRYKRNIPPGFADKDKEGIARFGDLIIWMQLLDKAKEAQQPVILVTDEKKPDWWSKYEDRVIGPHPLLREEMKTVAGQPFYLYTGKGFASHAERYLPENVEAEAKRDMREAAEERGAIEIIADVEIYDGNLGMTTTTTPNPQRYKIKDDMGRWYRTNPLLSTQPTQAPFQDPTILPPGAGEVPISVVRLSEFSQVGKLMEYWNVSGQGDDRLLTNLIHRAILLRGRWAKELPENLQGLLDTVIQVAASIPALPVELRQSQIDLLLTNTRYLVTAVSAL